MVKEWQTITSYFARLREVHTKQALDCGQNWEELDLLFGKRGTSLKNLCVKIPRLES
jgi:hypothetical protein